jgi:hypothetical protein
LQAGGEKKPAPKKPAAPAKARPSSAASGKSTERVKRVFDMPGQTRDTPGEVRNQNLMMYSNRQTLCIFFVLYLHFFLILPYLPNYNIHVLLTGGLIAAFLHYFA